MKIGYLETELEFAQRDARRWRVLALAAVVACLICVAAIVMR